MEKKWYQSKAVWGGVLVAASTIFGAVGGYLSGALQLDAAINAAILGVGALMAVIGIRSKL